MVLGLRVRVHRDMPCAGHWSVPDPAASTQGDEAIVVRARLGDLLISGHGGERSSAATGK